MLPGRELRRAAACAFGAGAAIAPRVEGQRKEVGDGPIERAVKAEDPTPEDHARRVRAAIIEVGEKMANSSEVSPECARRVRRAVRNGSRLGERCSTFSIHRADCQDSSGSSAG